MARKTREGALDVSHPRDLAFQNHLYPWGECFTPSTSQKKGD